MLIDTALKIPPNYSHLSQKKFKKKWKKYSTNKTNKKNIIFNSKNQYYINSIFLQKTQNDKTNFIPKISQQQKWTKRKSREPLTNEELLFCRCPVLI